MKTRPVIAILTDTDKDGCMLVAVNPETLETNGKIGLVCLHKFWGWNEISCSDITAWGAPLRTLRDKGWRFMYILMEDIKKMHLPDNALFVMYKNSSQLTAYLEYLSKALN